MHNTPTTTTAAAAAAHTVTETSKETHDADHHYNNSNDNDDDDDDCALAPKKRKVTTRTHDATLPHWSSCTDYLDAMRRRARQYETACDAQRSQLRQLWGSEPPYAVQAEDEAGWLLGTWFFSWLGNVMYQAAKEQLPLHALPQPLREARAYNAGRKLSRMLQAQHFVEHTWDYLCDFVVLVVHTPSYSRHHNRCWRRLTCPLHCTTTAATTRAAAVVLLRRLRKALVRGCGCCTRTKRQSLPDATDVLEDDHNVNDDRDEGRRRVQQRERRERSEAEQRHAGHEEEEDEEDDDAVGCYANNNNDENDEDEDNGEESRKGRLGVLCGVGPAVQYGHPDRRYARVRWLDGTDTPYSTYDSNNTTMVVAVGGTRRAEGEEKNNAASMRGGGGGALYGAHKGSAAQHASGDDSRSSIRHVNVTQLAFTLPPASLLDPPVPTAAAPPPTHASAYTAAVPGAANALPCGGQYEALPECARRTPRSMSVWRALFRAHGRLLLQLLPLRLCRDTCTVMVPVVLRMYIQYIENSARDATASSSADASSPPPLSVWHGLGVVLLLSLFLIVQTLCTNKYFHLSFRTAYTMRSALASVIFEKCLRLSSKSAALPAVNAGRVVNLLSNDVTRVEQFTLWCWVSVGAAIQLVAGIAILYFLLGKAAFVSIAVLLLPMPLQKVLIGRVFAAFGEKSAATDARLRATNEFLGGIRVVKFMSWEPSFVVSIEEKRRSEVAKMRTLQQLIILVVSLTGAIPQLIVAAVFVTYVSLNTQPLTASIVFPVLSLLTVLQMPLYSVPVVVSSFSQFFVSMRRITRLVECEDAEGLQSMLHALEAEQAEERAGEGGQGGKDRRGSEGSNRGSRAAPQYEGNEVHEGSATHTAQAQQQYEYEWADADPSTAAPRDVAAYFHHADIAAYEAEKVPLRGRAARRLERRQARRRAKARRTHEKQSRPGRGSRAGGSDNDDAGTRNTAQAPSSSSPDKSKDSNNKTKKDAKDEEKKDEGAYYAVRPKTVLRDITLRFPRNGLTVVLGPTGSGKSTLLLSLIGATHVSHGLVGRTGAEGSSRAMDVAYVAQQPWIMNATLRDNIVFFDAVDPARLARAIACSQLETDLALLADGLDTEIGEQGVNLSGGQKARVGLARAVYAGRALYLLDDPLSALDAHVGRRVLQDCVLGELAHTTRILATHHEYATHYADYIVLLSEHGRVAFAGDAVAYAIYKDLHSELPIVAEGKDGAEHKASSASDAEEEEEEKEEDKGKDSEVTAPEEEGEGEESAEAAGAGSKPDSTAHTAGRLMSDEEMATGAVPMAMYKRYAMACGGLRPWLFLFAIHLGTEVLVMAPMLWLSFWSTDAFALPVPTYLYVFLVLSILSIAAEPVRRLTSFPIMLHGSLTLHSQLLRSVAVGTMGFFDSTPLGRLLNRFSKDMDRIDFTQQEQVVALLRFAFSVISSLIVMVYTQAFILIPLLLCGVAYYKLMRLYSAANRTIRRYANLADAPVLASLTTVVAGRWTIAVYGKAADILRDVLHRLDRVYACNYLQNVGSRWLSVRVGMLSNVVVSSIALLGVLTMAYTSAGQSREQRAARVGFISLSLTLGMRIIFTLNEIVELLAQVEANMNCMERIAYYIDNIPHEEDIAVLDEVVAQYASKIMQVVQQAEVTATAEAGNGTQAEHSASNEDEGNEHKSSTPSSPASPDTGATAGTGNSSSSSTPVTAEPQQQHASPSADAAVALHTPTPWTSPSSPHTAPASAALQAGSLEFDHVSMRYRPGLPLVLRDVSFAIAPRQKVGVVGRTGSGKSTLLLTFLRLVNISAGTIRVCGRDAAAYPLPALRRLFAMIPQDPVLFEGTVRSNIDPFAEASEAAVQRALELVGIATTSSNNNSNDSCTPPSALELAAARAGDGSEAAMTNTHPATNICSSNTSSSHHHQYNSLALQQSSAAITMATPVQEGGSNFSVGQRQLLCLARALLKRDSAFLLMDEATANVDPVLDRQIQRVVREQFVNYTVITIAHRLHTVAGYDTVLVMQKGRLVEQGSPRELVRRPQSLFREMVIQAAMSPSSAADYGAEATTTATAATAGAVSKFGAAGEGGTMDVLPSQSAELAQRRAEQAVEEFLQQCGPQS